MALVADTSALLCAILSEPETPRYQEALAQAKHIYVSAASVLEAAIVAENRDYSLALDDLLLLLRAEIIAVDEQIITLARHAYRKYGKGRHPANLNFGDSLSYATAQLMRLPLLFKGDDFSKTDIPRVASF